MSARMPVWKIELCLLSWNFSKHKEENIKLLNQYLLCSSQSLKRRNWIEKNLNVKLKNSTPHKKKTWFEFMYFMFTNSFYCKKRYNKNNNEYKKWQQKLYLFKYIHLFIYFVNYGRIWNVNLLFYYLFFLIAFSNRFARVQQYIRHRDDTFRYLRAELLHIIYNYNSNEVK